MPGQKRVSLRVIAEELGVSTATVSNAYNRPAKLSSDLRDRILATADRLGYPGPDPFARGFRSQRTGAVAWLLFESMAYAVSDPVTLTFFQGMADELVKENVNLLVLPAAPNGGPSADSVRNAMVDGFVAYSLPADDPALAAALDRQVPTVVVEQPALPDRPSVMVDSFDGSRAAGRHLAALGHRRIGVLLLRASNDKREGPRTYASSREIANDVSRQRLDGYLAGLETAGIRLEDVLLYECESAKESGIRGFEWMYARSDPPTAVLAMSDLIAMGVIEGALSKGVRVPDELSVIGFDDAPLAATFDPPLTTVHQPVREKGRLAARLLLEPSEPARTVELPTTLIIRSSTAPATA